MTVETASHFINFLKAYVPNIGNNAQFDEHVTQVARDNHVQPFKFVFNKQLEYKSHIGACINKHESKVFLISGQAGDGKTHFLHDICTDPQLFNLTEDTWLSVLHQDYDYLAVDANGHIDPTSTLLPTEAIKRGVKSIHFTDRALKLYIVTDLTCIERNSDKQDFFSIIENVAHLNLARKANASAAGAAAGAATTAAVAASAAQAAAAAAAGAAGQAVTTIVLVAGNNGRILSTFNDYERYALSSHAKVRREIERLTKSLEKHMILKREFRSDFMRLMPMSECVDRQAVENIFKTVLEDSNWSKCSNCSIHEKCPILANRKALNNDNVIRHFADLYELAKDDGMHFTVRNLLVVICNAILGNKDKATERFYTCRKASFDVKKQFDAPNNYEKDRRSSPFDNLLGINLSAANFHEMSKDSDSSAYSISDALSTPPIFVQLSSFGIGEQSSKLIDDFIVHGCTDDNSAAGIRLNELLSNYDAAELKNKLKYCLELLQEPTDSDSETENQAYVKNMKSYMDSLRRLLFFTADERSDNAQLNADGFSTYSLSSLNYAKNYLKFKHIVRNTHNLNDNELSLATVKQLLDGLNRVFTSLSVVNSNKKVFITSNNIINPSAFCIVPDDSRYILNFDGSPNHFQDVIRIVPSALLNDVKNLPTLVYYPPADTWAKLEQEGMASSYENQESNLSDLFDEAFITSALQHISEDNYFKGVLKGKSINIAQISDFQKFKRYYEHLKEKAHDETLLSKEQSLLNSLSSQFDTDSSSTSSISYPEESKAGGRYPVVAEKLILSPRLFDYLMCLGAGDSSISFSDECNEELTAFKTRIDAFKAKTYNGLTSDGKPSIAKLMFCHVDDSGQIIYS